MGTFMPPRSPWHSSPSRTEVPNPQMRVSDAERSELADLLSKHYSEGRLDEAKFNERLQQAMSAKTRGDLAGLLVDLPPLVPPTPPEMVTRSRRGRSGLLVIAALVFAMAVSSAMWTMHFPWFRLAIVFFVVWRMSQRGWHRHGGP
jgi:Domain of unknown function (DUF1707)